MDYKKLFTKNSNMIELDCMVHARRKFCEFYQSTQSLIAKTTLDFFACLYRIESGAKDVSVQKRSEPILQLMKEWLD